MPHSKKEHVLTVSHCNTPSNGICVFGEENCWLQHGEINKSHENEKNEIQMVNCKMMK